VIETEVGTDDSRRLHVYDSVGGPASHVVYWLHGSGMSGLPPAPLLDVAGALGVRIVSHDRPGYASSDARPGRSVADGAVDVVTVLDALGIASAGVLGLSAGGMHALAAAALAPDRVPAAAVLGCPAPFGAVGLDWFAGMSDANRAELDAALRGADALRAHLADRGVLTAVHYPVPIHRTAAFGEPGPGAPSLPAAERLAEQICTLPLYPGMTAEDAERIVQAVHTFDRRHHARRTPS